MGKYSSLFARYGQTFAEELKQEQAEFLLEILGNPKKITRIFRASEHAFSAAAFHNKCDGVSNTLTLVRN